MRRVTRPAFQRLFAHLALLAALLTAVMPTAGRLLGVGDAAQRWVELCTAQGAAWVDLDALDSRDEGKRHGGDDCPYCPLGANQLTPASGAGIALLPTTTMPCTVGERPAHAGYFPRGLGSRGPPRYA